MIVLPGVCPPCYRPIEAVRGIIINSVSRAFLERPRADGRIADGVIDIRAHLKARGHSGFFARGIKRRQNHRRQKGNDGDYHQKFNEGKTRSFGQFHELASHSDNVTQHLWSSKLIGRPSHREKAGLPNLFLSARKSPEAQPAVAAAASVIPHLGIKQLTPRSPDVESALLYSGALTL